MEEEEVKNKVNEIEIIKTEIKEKEKEKNY